MENDQKYIQGFLYIQSYFLGPVFAGSGVYREGKRGDQPYRLDWALIQFREQRLGPNQVRPILMLRRYS